MQKFPSPLPHDLKSEEIEFRKAFASAMRKTVAPPAVEKASVLVVTTPMGAGQSAGHPESCLFPQRQHDVKPYAFATGLTVACDLCSGDSSLQMWDVINGYDLDAPHGLPSGGCKAVVCGPFTYASACVGRE